MVYGTVLVEVASPTSCQSDPYMIFARLCDCRQPHTTKVVAVVAPIAATLAVPAALRVNTTSF